MKIYFFGTPEFAVPTLKMLASNSEFKIQAVVTQPDKPGNRGVITPPPVKTAAKELGLKTLQPEKIDKTLIETIKKDKPDVIIVVAYGELIPKSLLNLAKHGCINIHPSLLPKYRGASPIQEALLNGDDETGIAIMKLDEELDHGPLHLLKRIQIDKTDTYKSLSKKLSETAAVILPLALKDIEKEILKPIKQNDTKATFCRKLTKKDGEINWDRPAQEILNQIRALNPWPSTHTEIKGKKLKVLQAQEAKRSCAKRPAKGGEPTNKKPPPGTIEILDKESFGWHTKDALIVPSKVQLEGKSETTTKEFLNGYKNLL